MLASITPLGERGRQATWGVTVTAFVLGAGGAAVAAGALLGAAGWLLLGSLAATGRLAVLAAAGAIAVALDLRAAHVPGPRRQVDDRWLYSYRGWVYGAGYGAQLGLAVTTVVASAATYVAVVAAFLTGSASRGALVLGCFGIVRGLSLLAGARVRRPEQLIVLHSGLVRWRAPVARAGSVVLLALVATAVVGAIA